jgi:hypothetical protein
MEVESQIYAPATLATTPWYLFDLKMIKQKKPNMDVILKWKTPV